MPKDQNSKVKLFSMYIKVISLSKKKSIVKVYFPKSKVNDKRKKVGPKAQIINFMKYKGYQDIKSKFIFTLKGRAHSLGSKSRFCRFKGKISLGAALRRKGFPLEGRRCT